MSALNLSRVDSASWQHVAHPIIGGDPLEVLDRLDVVARRSIAANDVVSQAALSANALAFMLVDWSRFTDWQAWIKRFEASDALLPPSKDTNLSLVRATGALASALLRGDSLETLAPLGQRLESLMVTASDPTQMALTAGALLPWLQMSRNTAGAQALRVRMTALVHRQLADETETQYLLGAWLGAWAQHLHFTDRARLPEALQAFDDYLRQRSLPGLRFRRARLTAENALHDQDGAGAERAARDMLDALHAKCPMERVIYNAMATAFACSRNDIDSAVLHVGHMVRDLEAADCPPSLATVYRQTEARVYLTTRDYGKAAAISEHSAQHAHTVHAAAFLGTAALARALLVDRDGSAQREALREHLQLGLAAMRGTPAINFLVSVPEARAAVCALALREGIETAFVLSALRLAPVPPPAWADENWPWAMCLRCFGGFRSVALLADGQSANKASSRLQKLLMLITAHGAQGVPVAVATDALWPGQDGDQAENALSMTLLRLRRLHTETDLIHRRGGWLHLNPLRVWTDVSALEAQLEALPEDAAMVSARERIKYVTRLFDLYRGDCLFGIEDEWARRRAAHYRGRTTTATQQILKDALQAEHHAAAELALTYAHERGLDLAHLLGAVRPSQRSTPAWTRLQRHAAMLESY